MITPEIILSGIYIYPIKSLKGIPLTEAKVEGRGLQYDRRWMLINSESQFLSQREHEKLATISVSLGPTMFKVTAPGMEPLFLPINGKSSEIVRVRIWAEECPAEVVGGNAAEWFSECLTTRCKLVHMPDQTSRPVRSDYSVNQDAVSFADAFPFLLTNEASLRDLNDRLEEKVPMNRFRPNFIVRGADPFAEDRWKVIRIGSCSFHVVKPCSRCVTTTIDQDKGVRTGTEPLKTLSTFRLKDNEVFFGENLIAANEGGSVRLGDRIEVEA